MKSAKKIILLLLGIILIGSFLRLYRINDAPVGMLVDEPAFGYSAYSILKTGKDEWGKWMPIVFNSYGDQKMPLYVYLLVPLIPIFDLTNTLVRLPAAVAGIILIPLVYLLLQEFKFSKKAALLTSGIVAISPSFIMLSRLGREASLGLIFFTAGILFFAKAFNTSKTNYFILAGVFLGVSWYTYVAYRFVTILFLPVTCAYIAILYPTFRKKLALCIAAVAITVVPIVVSGNIATARVSQVGFFADEGPKLEIIESRNYCRLNASKEVCYLLWNKPVVYGKIFIQRFIDTYSINYLFQTGDKGMLVLNVDKYGQFFNILIPFYLIGIYSLIKKFLQNKKSISEIIMVCGIFMTPIPAIIAGEEQKMRIAVTLVFAVIIIAYGIETLFQLEKKKIKKGILIVTSVLLAFQTIRYSFNYITIHISKYGPIYGSYIPDLASFVKKQPNSTKIYVNTFLPDFIMNYAFLTKIDPQIYQKETKYFPTDSGGFTHAKQLQNVEVSAKSFKQLVCESNGEEAFYITNEKNVLKKPTYEVKSQDKVHVLASAYKIEKQDCESIK